MNPYPTLPPIHHLPIQSSSPSPSPSSSSSLSLSHTNTNSSSNQRQHPPSYIPSPHHHQNNFSPSRTEELKTSLEQAKLDQRRQEYALLRDALRRGVPYSVIPGLLAARDSSVRKRVGHDGYGLGGEEIYQHGLETGSRLGTHDSSQAHGQGQGQGQQAGVVYYIPAPTDTLPIPPEKRRLDLDDSFLNRAYKRRRPWTGATRGRSAQGGERTQRITFHHWVPEGGK
ncbi:uncharacterized protein KD926_006217 [Aspergillus affinis]|uniref:uncharacterized protein n=1 Tax=Aspergillus affinis TaxID=1070780 RepID=UPI0022FDE86D|nr:uncharacterized protein KD926_006217 [Aspergillus affinis]KAI9042093.1 hypothetical protein KD926_006217 [Aspergillus affinis]